MGNCGISQRAATDQNNADADIFNQLFNETTRNHELCPIFYVSAFDHEFPAVDNKCCTHKKLDVARPVPVNYNMGYGQANKG